MRTLLKQIARLQNHRGPILGAALLTMLPTLQSEATPISVVTFKDDAPFAGSWGATNSLTSADGLLTVQGWADPEATVPASLGQWSWILGVGPGNGALIDGQDSMTLQFDKSVGCGHIAFLYSGDNLNPGIPAPISISGFSSDPGAYAYVDNQWPHSIPHIASLSYSNGTVWVGYLYDSGTDIGELFFANPAASAGGTLKIIYHGTNWGASLFQVGSRELYGGLQLQPFDLGHNITNAYTTPDGGLTVRGYSDRNALTSAHFGTYNWTVQYFGVMGGGSVSKVDTNESVTLAFANGFGLSKLELVSATSGAQISISGFQSDPGFVDNGGGSYSPVYADGVLTFYPMDGGRHAYFFANRAASAGQTLKITIDPVSADPVNPNQFAIAGIGYAGSKTLLGPDVPSNVSVTHTTTDGLLTLASFLDTTGTTPGTLYQNTDWIGIAGGNNNEAIEGTESMNLQFAPGIGLSSLGTRYTWANVSLSGFASDPGFTDPSGMATGVSYSDGTLSFHLESWRVPELVFNFANIAASAGRTLTLHTSGETGEQIALTRVHYATVPATLSIARYGSDVVLTWPSGTLQQSTSVSGTYSDITTATSPYTNAISGSQKFFRVKVQ